MKNVWARHLFGEVIECVKGLEGRRSRRIHCDRLQYLCFGGSLSSIERYLEVNSPGVLFPFSAVNKEDAAPHD